jgi:Uma2 family endonuclease
VSTAALKQPAQSSAPGGINVSQFEQLAESPRGFRIELIDGRVYGRHDVNPPHVLATVRTRRAVEPLMPNGRFTRQDAPVRISDYDEPFPDLAVSHGEPEAYANRHPGPEDISLVIEVADTTLAKDRGEKRESYARAPIPVYWIVNLVDRQVEVYSSPQPGGYATRADYGPGQTVAVVLDGTIVGHVPVVDILPP